ncbi:ATP-dependent helicase [Lujinxingia sediminis]|uniref:DNA 3'-5' helicase n=1 Tax=Lujinxingia sediminis TaxID=2480984 RepID=A0ABY0CT09_9DELT|nr:ATP-dependent helicase [Lujinxingia sediminis]RVU44738.1 ATP-dependent helicase [Lujinxingia sediminis]
MKTYKLNPTPGSASGLDFERDLNDEQRQVVTAGSGPLLVIAGAGTGKTHTLTYRVAYLVSKGVPPENILLLTFTNRAARAMTSRASALITTDVTRQWSGTFHSVANRILREHAPLLGYPRDYTIIDGEDAQTLMKSCIAEAGVGHLDRKLPRASMLTRLLSTTLNTGVSLSDALFERYPYFAHLVTPIEKILRLYQIRKHEMGLMDFDDLLVSWHRLLTEHPEVRRHYATRFEHILVDEYQDTNQLQGAIVDLMASVHGNLMVVGDDCQSIYAFRGADYRNILEFPERYPDARQYRLEINYRSTPQILELANRSIRYNIHQFQKTLRADRPGGPLPAHIHVRDPNQQAAFVCQRILELVDEGTELSNIAVLYRSHHHSLELQLEMTRCEIPFVVRSGLRFFEQAHIKDALSYLRFLFNPRDELAFLRLVRQWYGIGNKRAQDIWLFLSSQPDALAALDDPALLESLGGRAKSSWERASTLLTQLRSERLATGPDQLLTTLLRSDFKDHIQSSYDQADNRIADLEQLANYAAQYESLDHLLGEISLLSGISGQEIGVGEAFDDQFVCLSSVHQAKGLEWDAVFILSLSDGEFPHQSASQDQEQMEEERRLFYVATTRAKRDLHLCHPLIKTTRDRTPVVLRESPFVQELRDESYVEQRPLPWEDWKIEA